MNPSKLNYVCDCLEEAFQKVAFEIAELKFTRNDNVTGGSGKNYLVVVGLLGLNNGRILFTMDEGLVQKIMEGMNGEPMDNDAEICIGLAEFTNMVSGNGIISINNNYIGNDLRLTPPAIFIGNQMEITTLKVDSVLRSYQTEQGAVQIEVGFEGQ